MHPYDRCPVLPFIGRDQVQDAESDFLTFVFIDGGSLDVAQRPGEMLVFGNLLEPSNLDFSLC